MDRNDFNNLTLDEQVNYYRAELAKGNNFNAICKSIGVSKNTIKPRFAKAGYIEVYKGKTNIVIDYIKEGERMESIDLDREYTATKEIAKEEVKSNNSQISDEASIEIIKRIESMENRIKHLEKNKNTSSSTSELVISSLSSNTVTRTFKVDAGVNLELENFIKKYSMYKKQDIISSLLKLALDSVNK